MSLDVVAQRSQIKSPPEAVDLKDVIAFGTILVINFLLFDLANDLLDRVRDGALGDDLLLNHLLEYLDKVIIRLFVLG